MWVLGCASPASRRAREFQDPTEALESVKPEATDEVVTAAEPQLEQYLRRVLKDPALTLVQARLFSEGHINETWYLSYEREEVLESAVLKIFADAAAAEGNRVQYQRADERRWPIPDQLARGVATPYVERPALLMEFIAGGTLESRVKALFDNNRRPFPDEVAQLYGDVARAIGILHKDQRRARQPGDRSGRKAMTATIERCKAEGWCGEAAQRRFEALAEAIDSGPVTFIHGDLYESQVVLKPKGTKASHIQVAAFLDLDESGMGDPAVDLGSLLAHVLVVHPRTRRQAWGIPDPTPAETQAVARRVLDQYREGARIADEHWAGFVTRVRGWMWIRLSNIIAKYAGSDHAAELLKTLSAVGPALTETDPLEALEP